MSGSDLYRSVLRGKQEPASGGPMSPMSSLALSLSQRANLSQNIPKRTLSLTNSEMPTTSFASASKLSTSIFHDNSENKFPSRRIFSSPSREDKSPSRRFPSKDKENFSSPYYSPSKSSKSKKSFASPLKDIKNTCHKSLNFSPLKDVKNTCHKNLSFSPLKDIKNTCHKNLSFSPLKDTKNICNKNLNFSPFKKVLSSPFKTNTNTPNKINGPEDCDASSQDSGYSSEKKYDGRTLSMDIECAPRKLNLDLSPPKATSSQTLVKTATSDSTSSNRSFSYLSMLDDEDTILMDFMNEDISFDETQPKGFSTLLSAPINSSSSEITSKSSPSSPNPIIKSPVQKRATLFDQPRLPIKKCVSMMDTTPFRTAFELTTSPISSRVPVLPLPTKKEDSPTFKRPQPPIDVNDNLDNKRRKIETPSCVQTGTTTIPTIPSNSTSAFNVFRIPSPVSRQSSVPAPVSPPATEKQKLFRSNSESQVSIMKALSITANSDEKLTGDLSRPIALPIIESAEHPDLPSISCETMADLINGKHSDKINSFKIIDCRYPYEFDGGHIKGAESWHNPQMVHDHLAKQKTKPTIPAESQKRDILIFHCEFSQKRGPYAQRMLRSADRTANYASYPALHFPEMYVLEGGYKVFYQQYPKLCTPEGYVPMVDKKFSEDYKHFRAKSKSWATESRKGSGRIPPGTAIKKLGL